MRTGLVVLSGGMDSAVLLYKMKKEFNEIFAITFDYGQRHRKEIVFAKLLADRVGVVDHQIVDLTGLSSLLGGSSLTSTEVAVPDGHYTDESMKATVVPNRNMIMLAIAAGYAISKTIDSVGIAVHSGDHAIYPDCRPEFIKAFCQALRSGNYIYPEIYTPFISKNKTEIAVLGVKLGVPFEDTWSCYKGGLEHCGTCGTCVERLEALKGAGVL